MNSTLKSYIQIVTAHSSKVVCVYHAHCLDGFGSAFVLYKHYGSDKGRLGVKFIEGVYQEKPNLHDFKDKIVFILDFSYPPEVMESIADVADTVIWLDHHHSAIEAMNEYFKERGVPYNLHAYTSKEYSGVGLTYNYFYGADSWPDAPYNVPLFVQHIQDRDLWKFKYLQTKPFIEALRLLPQTFAKWEPLWDLRLPEYTEMISKGEAILAYNKKRIEEIIHDCCSVIHIDGATGAVANCPHYIASEVGNALAIKSGTFGATWYENDKKEVVFSLRSVGDYDVSAIAKKFGGGGHINAAGFKLQPHSYDGIVNLWSSSNDKDSTINKE